MKVGTFVKTGLAVSIMTICTSLSGQTLESTLTGVWQYPMSEDTESVIATGGYAYSATYYDGLVIYDTSNPKSPIKLSSIMDNDDYMYDLFIVGTTAYVANSYSGLLIIDVSDPSNPVKVGSFLTSGEAYGVTVAGNYAYMAIYSDGLEIVDISNPSAPVLAGSFPTSEYMYDVVVDNNMAYVADYGGGLKIIDVMNPASPTLSANYDSPGYSYGIAKVGDYAYLADNGDGLRIINVSNPSEPYEVGFYDSYDYVYGVDIIGDHAFLAVDYTTLEILDISDKTSPVLISSIDTSDDNYAYNVDVDGNYAYIADYNGVTIIDVSDVNNPTVVLGCEYYSDIESLVFEEDTLYIGFEELGLQILDISNPDLPILLGGLPVDTEVDDIAVESNYAYFITPDDMRIADVSDPASPTEKGTIAERYNIRGLFSRYPYVYLADKGLRIIDVSDSDNPVETGYFESSDSINVFVDGNHAYLANRTPGIQILNILNSASPTLVATYSDGNYLDKVVVRDGILYAIAGDNGLEIIDVSDPSTPSLISNVPTSNFPWDLELRGSFVFVSTGSGGLDVIDVSEPATASKIHTYDSLDNYLYATSVDANRIYLSSDYEYLEIVELGSSDAGLITSTTHSLSVSANVGESPGEEKFTISNAGIGSASYTVTTSDPWLSASPVLGTLSDNVDTITVTFSTGSLPSGYHSGTVNIESAGNLNSPYTISVELWLEPNSLSVSSSILSGGTEMVVYSDSLAAAGGIVPYSWKVSSDWSTGITNSNDGIVSGTPLLAGNYQATVEVSDAMGMTASGVVSYQIVENPNRPPIISNTDPISGGFVLPEEYSQIFSVSASDPEGTTLSYSWFLDGNPVGLDSPQYTYDTSWGDAGSFTLEVFIKDDLWENTVVTWDIDLTSDNDGDGIPNDFENAHPLLDAWIKADGSEDPDGDKLDNYGEYMAGTLLDDPDTDNDSLPDGWEVKHGHDPIDPAGGLLGMLSTPVGRWVSGNTFDGQISTMLAEPPYVYIAYHERVYERWVTAINVSDPTTPTRAGSVSHSGSSSYFRDSLKKGDILYQCQEGGYGIFIIDFSDPDAPSRYTNRVNGEFYGLDLVGNYLYATDYYNGLKIYDVTFAPGPTLVGQVFEYSSNWDLKVIGDYAFVGSYQNGLGIYNVADPASPKYEKMLSLGRSQGRAFDLEVVGDYAFVANGEAGLAVVDISDPPNSSVVAHLSTPGTPWKIQIQGNYAYLSTYSTTQVVIVDISEPLQPLIVGQFVCSGNVYDAQAVGDYLYAGTSQGMDIGHLVLEDADRDGLADAWELDVFGDMDQDENTDFDEDGVTDLGEYRAGFDALDTDSDDDGVSDGDEVAAGTSPLDAGDNLGVNEITFIADDSVTLTWKSIIGYVYEVQFSTTMIGGTWSTLGTVTATEETSAYTHDPVSGSAEGFYRIVIKP